MPETSAQLLTPLESVHCKVKVNIKQRDSTSTELVDYRSILDLSRAKYLSPPGKQEAIHFRGKRDDMKIVVAKTQNGHMILQGLLLLGMSSRKRKILEHLGRSVT